MEWTLPRSDVATGRRNQKTIKKTRVEPESGLSKVRSENGLDSGLRSVSKLRRFLMSPVSAFQGS